MDSLEAFDALAQAQVLQERLSAAAARVEDRKREKDWLRAAVTVVHEACEAHAQLFERARQLPELAFAREEQAKARQSEWVDALEKLLAGITMVHGSRAPIVEALFPKAKLPALRKAKKDAVQEYGDEFERRLGTAYVKRMLAAEESLSFEPGVARVRETFAAWKAAWGGESLPESEAQGVREALAAAAAALEVPVAQARLLAQAALAPLPGAFEEAQLAAGKPKKKKAAPAREDLAQAPTP